jgi:dihydrofolate reductase
MSSVVLDITMSLDGFVAGPDMGPDDPMGRHGMRLHEWAFGLATFKRMTGEGGGLENADDEIMAETQGRPAAVVMGRGMFGGGPGPWGAPEWGDGTWEGWWGPEPPYHKPVFVLTHHEREPLVMGETTFTFVTDGIASAIEQAKAAAGDGDVLVAGGADAASQALAAGLLDEIQVHVVPLLLGSGKRLFAGLDEPVTLEKTRGVDSPGVTHLRYRVVRSGPA